MTRLLVLVSGQVMAVFWLWRLTRPRLAAFAASAASTQEVALGALHLAATLAACWLLFGTAHDVVVVLASGGTRRGATPPWVRRIVDQALGTVLLLGVMSGPAMAGTPAATPALAQDISDDFSGRQPSDPGAGRLTAPASRPAPALAGPPAGQQLPLMVGGVAGPPTGSEPPSSPALAAQPAPTPTAADSLAAQAAPTPAAADSLAAQAAPTPVGADSLADDPAPAAPPDIAGPPGASGDPHAAGDPEAAGHHRVSAGENLWVIARAQLMGVGSPGPASDGMPADPGATTSSTGRSAAPSDREVHAYWVRLMQANIDQLRSGDPDLIHPGEVLVLPAVADGVPAPAREHR